MTCEASLRSIIAESERQRHKLRARVDEMETKSREVLAKWMMENGFSTGRGETVEDLLAELRWQIETRTNHVQHV